MLLTDLCLFYPSALLLVNQLLKAATTRAARSSGGGGGRVSDDESAQSTSDYLVALALILFNPTIVLIDHGHFQYNCARYCLPLVCVAISVC